MIILESNGRTIEFSIDNKVTQTEDRKKYSITVPKIICTSRTDAEKMQEYVNTFVYNLAHELLDLDTKLTSKETKLAEIKEEPKTKVKKEK